MNLHTGFLHLLFSTQLVWQQMEESKTISVRFYVFIAYL